MRNWLEMVMLINTYDLVSYNILKVFVLVGRGTVQLLTRIALIQTPSSFFIMQKKWKKYSIISHDHDPELMTAVKAFIISYIR